MSEECAERGQTRDVKDEMVDDAVSSHDELTLMGSSSHKKRRPVSRP